MRIVLLGMPGVGKGTQAKLLSLRKGLTQIATGDLLRQEVENGTELGRLAKEYMDQGELVPDQVIIGMMEKHLEEAEARGGYLLDGFPRTVQQAIALDEHLERNGKRLDYALALVAPEEEVVSRLAGRLTCVNCGATYHETNNPPKTFGVCDVCSSRLQTRPDDEPEAVRNRLRVYLEKSAPLLDYYREKSILREIHASGTIEEVYDRIESVLEG